MRIITVWRFGTRLTRLIASNHKKGTPVSYEAFNQFISLLEDSDYGEEYLGGNASALARAYYKFVRCEKEEVHYIAHDGNIPWLDFKTRFLDNYIPSDAVAQLHKEFDRLCAGTARSRSSTLGSMAS
jgi:hypothetical protein